MGSLATDGRAFPEVSNARDAALAIASTAATKYHHRRVSEATPDALEVELSGAHAVA